MISALVGDICSSIVKVPREVITTKLQTSHAQISAWTVVRDVLRKDGPAGLFKGYFSVALRDSPYMIILFTSYEKLKQNFDHRFLFSMRFDVLDIQHCTGDFQDLWRVLQQHRLT